MKMRTRTQAWPDGKTWVFQGTVAEDATAGTHICSLTVTPGAGNEFMFLAGQILIGNTATAQTALVKVTDGTNDIVNWIFPADTAALTTHNVPGIGGNATTTNTNTNASYYPLVVSGTMQLILRVSTAAVSVTETFAVVCRIYGAVPTATLADTVGTPVLTTNTNAVF